MKNLAIFASGSGTNTENLIRYFSNSEIVKVVVVLSNNPVAGVHGRAKALGIPSHTFTRDEFATGEVILKTLQNYHVDFIVLAGFLAKVSSLLLNAYPRKIVNIHPALLPRYGGMGMYGMRVHQAVIEAGDRESGITIHYIDEHYDEGPVICQKTCPVLPEDTPESLAERVHALEYDYYPKVIAGLLSE